MSIFTRLMSAGRERAPAVSMSKQIQQLLSQNTAPTAYPPAQKSSRVAPLLGFSSVSISSLNRPQWTGRDPQKLIREGYARNAVCYRAIRLIVEAAASVPLLLFEGDKEHRSHPLLSLLARPNPREAGAELWQALYTHLLTHGNAYLECVASETPQELYALRPDRMRLIAGKEGWAEAYEYSVNGRSTILKAGAGTLSPVLHLKCYDPADDHYGMAPLAAAQVALDVHNAASAWNKALLDNSARPSGALIYGAGRENISDEEFERLKSELELAFQGAGNAGRPLVLEGGLDWKPLSLSPKDMDFLEAKASAAREIALALGVPPLLLGLPGDNTHANYAEANKAFWRMSILPLVSRTAASLAGWLSQYYGADLRLEPDLDAIPALHEERAAKWAMISAADFLSVAEKREALGYGVAKAG